MIEISGLFGIIHHNHHCLLGGSLLEAAKHHCCAAARQTLEKGLFFASLFTQLHQGVNTRVLCIYVLYLFGLHCQLPREVMNFIAKRKQRV